MERKEEERQSDPAANGLLLGVATFVIVVIGAWIAGQMLGLIAVG